jgi:hypothetical protein
MQTQVKKLFLIKSLIILVTLLGIILFTGVASAHETTTVGDYSVEYGWLSEPSVVGQPNAFVVNISQANAASPDIDVSNLQVQVILGPQSKQLTLQPLGEDTPGQFIAPITPMRPGVYTLHLGGSIGGTPFNTDVQPEEVKTADVVQFPVPEPTQAASSNVLGLPGYLAIAGIALGLFGTGFGVISFSRKTGS